MMMVMMLTNISSSFDDDDDEDDKNVSPGKEGVGWQGKAGHLLIIHCTGLYLLLYRVYLPLLYTVYVSTYIIRIPPGIEHSADSASSMPSGSIQGTWVKVQLGG